MRADALDFVLQHHANLRAFAWDAARDRLLDFLWRDMRTHGVQIIAYLPPYHPLVWESVRHDAGAMAGLARTRTVLATLAGPRAGCMARVLARGGVVAP